MDSASVKVQNLQELGHSLRTYIDDAKKELASINSNIDVSNNTLGRIKTEIGAESRALSDLGCKKDGMVETIQNLRIELETLSCDIAVLEQQGKDELESLKDSKNSIRIQINGLEKELTILNSEILKRNSQNEISKKRELVLSKNIKSLENTLIKLGIKVELSRKELDTIDSSKDTRKKRLLSELTNIQFKTTEERKKLDNLRTSKRTLIEDLKKRERDILIHEGRIRRFIEGKYHIKTNINKISEL